jgi:hypothetical protein
VTLYKAATLPTGAARIERLPLSKLPDADVDMHATLVIPPARKLEPDMQVRKRLSTLDAAGH